MGGTDCGFAQGAFVRRVHPEIQWAKLAALSEGARLATRRAVGGEGRGLSTGRILTTHVGSLVRPPALLELLRARRTASPRRGGVRALLRESVAEVVGRRRRPASTW